MNKNYKMLDMVCGGIRLELDGQDSEGRNYSVLFYPDHDLISTETHKFLFSCRVDSLFSGKSRLSDLNDRNILEFIGYVNNNGPGDLHGLDIPKLQELRDLERRLIESGELLSRIRLAGVA